MAITINFNEDPIVGNLNLGKIGEHNATELIITVPTALSEDSRTQSYRVAFHTNGNTVLSEAYTSSPITISLWKQLTQAPRLSLQVIAYDNDGNFIGKSQKLSGFYFEPSVPGEAVEADGSNSDLAHEILNILAKNAEQDARLTIDDNLIADLQSGKVDKEPGKGLSQENFTTLEKLKLFNLRNYILPIASATALGGVKIDGETIGIDEEGVIRALISGNATEIEDTENPGYAIDTPRNLYFRLKAGEVFVHNGSLLLMSNYSIDSQFTSYIDFYYSYANAAAFNTDVRRLTIANDKAITEAECGNFMTPQQMQKLIGIEAEAQKNVQADWNQNDSTKDDYIKNKPTVLGGQPDWNENNPQAAGFIKNRTHYSGIRTELINPEWDGDFTDENAPEVIQTFTQDDYTYRVYKLSDNPDNFDITQLKARWNHHDDNFDVDTVNTYWELLVAYVMAVTGMGHDEAEAMLEPLVDKSTFIHEPVQIGEEDGDAYIEMYGSADWVENAGLNYISILTVNVAGEYNPIQAGAEEYDEGIYAISLSQDLGDDYITETVPVTGEGIVTLDAKYLPASLLNDIEMLKGAKFDYTVLNIQMTSGSAGTCDKSASEIYQLLETNKLLLAKIQGIRNYFPLTFVKRTPAVGELVSLEMQSIPMINEGNVISTSLVFAGTDVTLTNNVVDITSLSSQIANLNSDINGVEDLIGTGVIDNGN